MVRTCNYYLILRKKERKCDDSIYCQLCCSHSAQPQSFKGINTSDNKMINKVKHPALCKIYAVVLLPLPTLPPPAAPHTP